MLAAAPDVLAVADCGRVDTIAPAWVGVAQLSLLLVRQAPTAGATVARVDRAIEVLEVLSAACPRVGVVLIGRAPYPPAEVEAALGMALFATLPEDPAGAALAGGGWTIGRGAGRSARRKRRPCSPAAPSRRSATSTPGWCRREPATGSPRPRAARSDRRRAAGGASAALVRSIADTVGQAVAQRAQRAHDAGQAMTAEAEKVGSATEIQRQLVAYNEGRVRRGLTPLSAATHEALVEAVMAHVYGLGELEALWVHPDVEKIDVNGADQVFVGSTAAIRRWPPIASTSDEELVELIRRASRRSSLNEVEFDARHPQLDVQLPDGSRLFAVFGGTAGNGAGGAADDVDPTSPPPAVGMDDWSPSG